MQIFDFCSFEVFHFINWINLRKIWNLQASYFSSEVLKLTNSIHILEPFAKQFQLWRFSIFPSCFIDEIGARFFSSKLLKHKKLKKSNFFPTESARKITSLFSKLFTLMKLSNVSLYFLDWINSTKLCFFLTAFWALENWKISVRFMY